MKHLYITILAFIALSFSAYSQDNTTTKPTAAKDLKTALATDVADVKAPKPIKVPNSWKFSFEGGLTGSQAFYSNWAAGGDNAISGRVYALHGGVFQKNRNLFKYNIDLALGYQWLWSNKENPLNKTDDKLVIDINYGYKIADKYGFYYSAFVNFRSQFANGLDANKLITSKFMAPGYLTYGVGIEYKLKSCFDVILSPIAVRHTFVLNDSIWLQGNYGITPEMIAAKQHVRTELGANLSITFNKDVAKNINISSKLTLYSNYLKDPQNVDVNFEAGVNFKINKFLSAGVFFNYIYDDDVRFTVVEKGVEKVKVPRSQFKESIYIGLVYKM